MTQERRDERPPVAVGHVTMGVPNVADTYTFLVGLGCREIVLADGVGGLEFRGGTHLVLLPTDQTTPEGAKAPFDLMVDDIEATRKSYAELGADPTEIREAQFHNSFTVIAPSGHEITVNSSHASGKPV